MDVKQIAAMMQENARRIQAMATGVSSEQARWKPDLQSWSILEVVCHLLDEEREDFRVRIDYTLHRPGETWPPIDPAGWVTQRRYSERELGQVLSQFLAERAQSLAWLQTLAGADWETTSIAPWGDPFPAGNLLASWAAHDLLHLRQLVELHWAYTAQVVTPYRREYAGDW